MQDLNKIEQEYLQANDVGDDAPAGLTREFAEQVETQLRMEIMIAAGVVFEQTGMGDLLPLDARNECFSLLLNHVSDAIGDMPIWDIVKRGEA